MYLSPVQSRPHSTVLSYPAVQPANAGIRYREENARFITAIGHFTASNSSQFPFIRTPEINAAEQFNCQIDA